MTLQRSNVLLTASMDGDVLLMMDVERGRYYGLGGVGRRIWELLEHPMTEAALVEALLDEYDVAPDLCTEQVKTFLSGLRERGLLAENPSPTGRGGCA